MIGNEIDLLIPGNAGGGTAFGKGRVGENEIDAPGLVFPLLVGAILRKQTGGEGATLEFAGRLFSVDEVNQPEGEELGHDGGVWISVDSTALGGLFVDGFLVLGACIKPFLVERGVAIEVPQDKDGVAGIEEGFGLRAHELRLFHAEGVLGGGEVHDENMHPLDLAVQVAVPHVIKSFLDDRDPRVGGQPDREAPFLEDDCVVMVPLLSDLLQRFLFEPVEFLERDDVGLLFSDPLRSDLRSFGMVETVKDIVSEDTERLSLGGMDTEEGRADKQRADHGY